MKTTRWFIEYNTFTHGWLTSMHNTAEGWESQEAANHWYENVLEKELQHCFRVVSREVEVSAKDVVKVLSRSVQLDVDDTLWRRKEAGSEIEWLHFDDNDDKIVEAYYSPDGKNWHHNYSSEGAVCEEPEVERIWREYNE
jgi:hypothetical protein